METNNIQINLLLLQMVLKKPVAFDKKRQKFYVIEKQGNETVFIDLVSNGEILFDISESDLIFSNSYLLNLPEPETEPPEPTEKRTQKKEKEPKTVESKFNLVDFSEMLNGYHKQTAQQIFELTKEILNNTTKQNSIDKVLQLYEKARRHALKAQPTDLNELIKIKNQLQGIRNKQKAIKKSQIIYQRKLKRKRNTIAFVVLFSIVFVVIILFKNLFFKPAARTQPEQTQLITLTESVLIQSILEYEQAHNIKVYQWRRQKIIETLQGKQLTIKEFNTTLDSLINKAWR